MTIKVKFGNQDNRWEPGLTFDIDKSDIRDIVWDYTGELGSDTISTATASTTDIGAGSTVIASNVVTIPMSGGVEGAKGTLDLTITTAGSDTISRTVNFRIKDF